MQKTSLSRSSIYARMAKQEFPEAVALGPNSIGWYENEVEEWITNRKLEKRNIRSVKALPVESLPLFKSTANQSSEW
ncbi:MAG: AlpA family transcriptional regulator [Bacteroidota bacterium]|nr:AlpA family transcriptional regulator [Bacteroidota bacterium]